jgi:L-alanine-DL-glutamate epimerase-like enolase superfamily enzyme
MTIPENVTITRIDAVVLEGTRPRTIGRNSHVDVHGRVASAPVVRLHTDQGVTGWGWSQATAEDAEALAGKNLHEVFAAADGTADDYLAFDFPL